MRECELPRDVVAERMSAFLGRGEEVTTAMLNAYASQARESHTISAIRLVALAHATNDMRALQVLVDPLGQAVIAARYVPAIEAEIKAERAEELASRAEEMRQQARRQWKGARR